MAEGEGVIETLKDLVGAFTPLSVRRLEREIDDRISKTPTRLNEYGYDAYGFHPDAARRGALPCALLYRYYFRVETHDISHVPQGGALLVGNHAGQLPWDGAMLGTAMLLEAEPPRICRPMGEYWISTIPWFNVVAARMGAMVGNPENCVAMLNDGEVVMVFPEGVRGLNKPFSERYRLQRFGQGFLRLSLQTSKPIVPVALVGSEEQQPGLANLPRLGRLLGMPAFPLTLGFPWLGPLGLLPLPVKYHIYFGEPLQFEGDPQDDEDTIGEKVEVVKQAIRDLFDRGLAERNGIFR